MTLSGIGTGRLRRGRGQIKERKRADEGEEEGRLRRGRGQITERKRAD
jgi:hypothetical protein